jgi:hypothetical protein
MRSSLSYTLGGRNVSRDQFFEGLEGEIRKVAADSVSRQVHRVRCSKHGQRASVTELRQTRNGISVDISGCCDELVQRAKDAIR